MLDSADVIALYRAQHSDPYAVLGMHTDDDGKLWVRSMQPGALAVAVIDAKTGRQVAELDHRRIEGVEGFFEGVIPRRRNYFPIACESAGWTAYRKPMIPIASGPCSARWTSGCSPKAHTCAPSSASSPPL